MVEGQKNVAVTGTATSSKSPLSSSTEKVISTSGVIDPRYFLYDNESTAKNSLSIKLFIVVLSLFPSIETIDAFSRVVTSGSIPESFEVFS